MLWIHATALWAVATLAAPASLDDPGFVGGNQGYGPNVTVEHLFYNDAPGGVARSSSGRFFANFGRPSNFTLGELVNGTHEVAFPSVEINSPPSLVNATNPQYGANYPNYLISLQAVYIAFNVTANTTEPAQIIVLPSTVAYPETFLNDIRIDLRSNVTSSGKGVAYITDSSTDGRNGLIVVDLGTGQSWRHLERHPSTLPEPGLVLAFDGIPFYTAAAAYGHFTTGLDGIAISADGEFIYYSALAARAWYRVRASYLRVPASGSGATPTAAIRANAAVEFLGQRPSNADSLEATSTGTIYLTAPERGSIYSYDPDEGMVRLYVRDTRLQWPDTLFAGQNGKLYFTVTQLWLQARYQNGTDQRQKPLGLLSVPMQGERVDLV